MPEGEPTPEDEAAALVKEFDAESEETRRIELVYSLAANGSAPARRSLEQIYRNQADERLKLEIVQALTFIDSPDFGPSLVLLLDAIQPTQPLELRTAAAEAASELNSPATRPLWQLLLADPEEELREQAKAAIEYLSALEPEP